MVSERDDLLRSALELSIPEPFILWTRTGRVEMASRRFLETLDLKSEEVEGLNEQELAEAFARKAVVPLPGAATPVLTTATGKQLQRERSTIPSGGFLDRFRNLTADRAEAERREEVLGIVSHDLRSPLANVRSYAGLMLTGRIPNMDPRVQRSAEVIARNADKALRLIQAYFDTVRSETGQFEVDRNPVTLVSLLRDLVDGRRAMAQEKGVELSSSFASDLPAVKADRERLGYAVSALVDNALARTQPRGKVEITAELRGREVWIGVTDTGPSLQREELRVAFDRDTQVLRERRLGEGFLLAVSRAIALAHGGDAGVQSSPHRTTFFVTLPKE